MKALTLHQPWASLVGLGVKTIETRSWATPYRGPLAIHAGARRPPLMHLPPLARGRGPEADQHNRETWLVIDTITDPAFRGPRPQGKRIPRRAVTPTMFFPHAGPHGRPWGRDAGTSAADQGVAVYLPLGAVVATCELVDVVPTADLFGPSKDVTGWRQQPFGGPSVCYGLDQLPLGDFTPGRYAWLLADVRRLDPPVAARGRQQLWTWQAIG